MMREAKRFVTMLLATAVVATSVPVISADAATVDYFVNGKKVNTVSVSDNEIKVNEYKLTDAHFEGWSLSGNTVSENCTISGNEVVSVNAIYSECDDDDVTTKDATCSQDGKVEVRCSVCHDVVRTTTIPKTNKHSWDNGKVTKEATTTEEGVKTFTCTVCGEPKTEAIAKLPGDNKCKEHTWDEGVVTKEATAAEEGVKTYTCTVCGETKTEAIAKIVPTIKLNVKSIKLQTGKSTTAVVASGLVEGDKVASWKSSNTKIVTVSKKGKITAKNKAGKATITVTTQMGAKATLSVTVQKKAVKLTKLTVNKKKVTLKKGEKFTLVATKTPITAQDKVTYKSSNTKVAKVSKKGVITTGKKTGKATITVKAGSKTVKVQVTVKKAAKKK